MLLSCTVIPTCCAYRLCCGSFHFVFAPYLVLFFFLICLFRCSVHLHLGVLDQVCACSLHVMKLP